MAPEVEQKPAHDHEEPASEMVEISRSELGPRLADAGLSSVQLAKLAFELRLSPGEIAALAAGNADLHLTRAQYEGLRASLAKQYGKAAANADGSGSGSLCGSSSSPQKSAPTATPVTKTVAPNNNTTPNHNITIAGTKAHEGDVNGGKVVLRTGAKEDIDLHPDNFTIEYKGPDSKNAHWLQFIHREVIGVHADASAHPVVGNIQSSGTRGGAGYQLTQGGTATKAGAPGTDNYNTDTASATDPFYESAFSANRTADSTTIIDLPSAMKHKVSEAFAAGAKSVVSRAAFDTYLVQVDKVTYHVQVTVQWNFAADTDDPRPTMTTSGSGAAAGLPADIRTKFHAQYPDFNFIK